MPAPDSGGVATVGKTTDLCGLILFLVRFGCVVRLLHLDARNFGRTAMLPGFTVSGKTYL